MSSGPPNGGMSSAVARRFPLTPSFPPPPSSLPLAWTPCRVVAQAVNYRSHAQESGFGERPPAVFFRKSSASVSGPTDDVIRPGHVRLLDYELELGLVMGRRLAIGATVTDAELPGYVAAVVMCNDLSARDVQLTKGQFYESKSHPTFTPPGPAWSSSTPTTSPGWPGCGCGCGSTES